MKISTTKTFVKQFRKLSKRIQLLAHEKESIFKEDLFDPRLKTHKLKGVMETRWSFSVNHQYRIVFRKRGDEMI
jgi:mRNA-degrading endonuclease YafQ of YafQ-DinJ toxin-antitoxin module